jgi:hypothetical protein
MFGNRCRFRDLETTPQTKKIAQGLQIDDIESE